MADRSHFAAELGQEVTAQLIGLYCTVFTYTASLREPNRAGLAPKVDVRPVGYSVCDNRRALSANRLLRFSLLLLLLCSRLALAQASEPALAANDTAARLAQALDTARQASGVPGAVACLAQSGAEPLYAASGVANIATGRAVRHDDYFAIGSITKMFVAVVVLQLAAEGKLSLDDPLAKYLPDFPRAEAITLRLLLQHKSGIGDPTRMFLFTNSAENQSSRTLLLAWMALALQQRWTPKQLTDLVALPQPAFAPGERCEYSNANYILLGRVIQLATGHQVAQEIRARILTPLGMAHTVFAGEEPLPATDMQCYDLRDGQYIDCLPLENASFAWCAGAMVSTAADLLRFTQALFGGALLPELLQQMLNFTPIEDWGGYGLGVTQHGSGVYEAWGHTGRTAGFSTCLWYYPADKSIVIVLANLQRCPLSPIVSAVRQAAVGPTTVSAIFIRKPPTTKTPRRITTENTEQSIGVPPLVDRPDPLSGRHPAWDTSAGICRQLAFVGATHGPPVRRNGGHSV